MPLWDEMAGNVFPVSLVMAVSSVVRMWDRSSITARAFSLDTKYTLSLKLRVVGVGLWVG